MIQLICIDVVARLRDNGFHRDKFEILVHELFLEDIKIRKKTLIRIKIK